MGDAQQLQAEFSRHLLGFLLRPEVNIAIDDLFHSVAGNHRQAGRAGQEGRGDDFDLARLGVRQSVDLGMDNEAAAKISIRPVNFATRRRSIVSAPDDRIVAAGGNGTHLNPWILASLGGGRCHQ